MSDMSQGPGWWLASDNRWYPPEQRPATPFTAAPAPGAPPRAATTTPYTDFYGTTVPRSPLTSPSPAPSLSTDFSSVPGRPATPGRRSRRAVTWSLVVAALVLVAGGAVVYSMVGGRSSISAQSPTQVLSLATAAAQKAGSVHVVTTIDVPGQTATYVNDTGERAGEQVITSSGGLQMTTVVVGDIAYVKANQPAMTTVFQASTEVARQYADRWLSFGSDQPSFEAIAATLTLGSLLREVTPSKPLSKVTGSTVDGRTVTGVRGELPGGFAATLYVSNTGVPLPVEELSSDSNGKTTSIFSAWGQPVKVQAPSGAVSGSTIPGLGSTDDRAAQSNLTNALTEVKALYQDAQSYTPNGTPMTVGAVESQAPEFSWTTAACGPASPPNCVSMQVVDASAPGDGQAMVLAVYSQGSGDCWYGLDLENPASSLTDSGQHLALVTRGRTPTGIGTPGVLFAEKSPATTASASTYCSANWAVTQARFGWGTDYSNPGGAA